MSYKQDSNADEHTRSTYREMMRYKQWSSIEERAKGGNNMGTGHGREG